MTQHLHGEREEEIEYSFFAKTPVEEKREKIDKNDDHIDDLVTSFLEKWREKEKALEKNDRKRLQVYCWKS